MLPIIGFAQEPAAASERAVLGINIASARHHTGPVEGVAIVGVTPGAAAAEAGLRADDVLIAIDDTSLTADSVRAANRRLLDFMSGVSPGQELRITYLRGDEVLETSLVADAFDAEAMPDDFPFRDDLEKLGRRIEDEVIWPLRFRWRHYGTFAGMELVALTPELGRYFGTDEGLLVVRAPTDAGIGLEDGDVIRNIGARVPNDAGHAMRILRSYEPGEELVIGVVRDKKEREVRLTLPDQEERTGWNFGPLFDFEKPVSETRS
ncbi:MAG: PDZ domain-containing protein [Gammaproteobacteria bacterium]